MLTVLIAGLISAPVFAIEWQERFKRQLATCQSIPDGAYETGLLFNPDGYRTYFKRSRCLQRLAIEWRDSKLCRRVKERKSLFFSGDAISEQSCLARVAEQVARDQESAASIQPESFHKLVNASFSRPPYAGNNILTRIETQGSHTGTYQIRVEVWPDGKEAGPAVIDNYGQPLGSEGHSLSRTIPDRRVNEAFGDQPLNQEVRARITLEFTARSLADRFILHWIPAEARRSSFDIRVNLGELDH